MFDTIHKRLAPLARLMLALVLLQSLFVVQEVVAIEADDSHHIASTLAESNESTTAGHADEAPGDCDHCCHCQGHGSHLAILVDPLQLNPSTPGNTHLASRLGLIFSRISSINRPPIL